MKSKIKLFITIFYI